MNDRWQWVLPGENMAGTKTNRRLGVVAVTETVRECFSNKWHLSRIWNKWQACGSVSEGETSRRGKISYRGIAFMDRKSQQFIRPESPSIHTFSCMSGATISLLMQKTVENVLHNLVTIRGMSHSKISDSLSRLVHIHTQYASHVPTVFFCFHSPGGWEGWWGKWWGGQVRVLVDWQSDAGVMWHSENYLGLW